MNRTNKFDLLIERLVFEFSQVPNFNLTQEDGKGNVIFNFLMRKLTEINSFKALFLNYYIPASSKAIAEDLKEIGRSKYKHLLKLNAEDLRENYYETIRLGYVGLFHKYENFISDLIVHAEILISDIETSSSSLEKYVKEKFNFKIKDWKNSPTVNKINWLCNCIKHYDGYPKKEPKHELYQNLPEVEKIKLTKDDFKKDIELLIKQYQISLQLVVMLAIYKMIWDQPKEKLLESINEGMEREIPNVKMKLEESIFSLISLIKQEAN